MTILSLFCGKFDKFNTTGAWMLDSICHDSIITLKSHILFENFKILMYMRSCYGHTYILLYYQIFGKFKAIKFYYLRGFSESRSSNGSTPSVCPSQSLLRCLVCIICNSKSFTFIFIQTLHNDYLKMCIYYFVHIS